VVAVAAAPARPVISPTFHAQVSVSLTHGTSAHVGGGIYSYDIKNNRARLDYTLEDQKNREHYIYLQSLQRYDLQAVYTIDDQRCSKKKVQGQLDNPWDFVAQATFVGTGTFRDESYDEWQYIEGDLTVRLAVRSKDTSRPVFLVEHDLVDGDWRQLTTTFEEFDTNEPGSWVFFIPQICENATGLVGGDVNAVVYFANNNWNCANVACSSRVAAGTGQPAYQCAEFAARSLAAGSYIPGLTSTAAQASYGSYRGQNLLLVTGLHAALSALGFKPAGTIEAAYALFGDGGDGAWSHACIGIGTSVNDCHNNARQGITTTGVMYKGVNAILAHN